MPKSADVRAVGEFAASRHGVFTRKQASELGLTKHDLAVLTKDGVIESVSRTVLRLTSYPANWRQTAYALTVEGKAVVSGATAAALHQLDGCDPDPGEAELIVVHATKSTRGGHSARRVRSLDDRDITEVDGIR